MDQVVVDVVTPLMGLLKHKECGVRCSAAKTLWEVLETLPEEEDMPELASQVVEVVRGLVDFLTHEEDKDGKLN